MEKRKTNQYPICLEASVDTIQRKKARTMPRSICIRKLIEATRRKREKDECHFDLLENIDQAQ